MVFLPSSEGVQNEDDLGGEDRPEPGKYHVVIKAVDESFRESAKSVIVDFDVVAGTVPGQEGKEIREYFPVSEKAVKRLQRLALVTQLISPGAPETDVSFSAAVGRQLIVEVVPHEYESNGEQRKTVRLSFMGMWSVGNPAVADVPKHAPTLSLIGGGGFVPPTAPPQQAPPQPTAVVPPTAPPQQVAQQAPPQQAPPQGQFDWGSL